MDAGGNNDCNVYSDTVNKAGQGNHQTWASEAGDFWVSGPTDEINADLLQYVGVKEPSIEGRHAAPCQVASHGPSATKELCDIRGMRLSTSSGAKAQSRGVYLLNPQGRTIFLPFGATTVSPLSAGLPAPGAYQKHH